MTSTSKCSPVRINIPKNKTELELMLGELGSEMLELAEIDLAIAKRLARIKELLKKKHGERREALMKTISKRTEKIATYADRNRAELLPEESKSVTLTTGELAFYFGPSAVVCEDEARAIEECQKKDLLDAIRVVTSLNREWIDEHKDEIDIAGVSHVQTEFLKIIPTGIEKGRVCTVREVEVE